MSSLIIWLLSFLVPKPNVCQFSAGFLRPISQLRHKVVLPSRQPMWPSHPTELYGYCLYVKKIFKVLQVKKSLCWVLNWSSRKCLLGNGKHLVWKIKVKQLKNCAISKLKYFCFSDTVFAFLSFFSYWPKCDMLSNGKTSIVYYQTLSFFALRLKKKRKFAFFRFFKYKITIKPVRFASIFKFFNIKMFASLRNNFFYYRTCSLRFARFTV